MAENIPTNPLLLVLVIATHMVLNGPITTEDGILGTNITLEFKFNFSIKPPVAVYVNGTKIAEYQPGKVNQAADRFYTYPANRSVFLQITNLTLNHNGHYYASVFITNVPTESDIVQLVVRNKTSPDPPVLEKEPDVPVSPVRGISSLLLIITVVVLPVVLLAVAVPWFIWYLLKSEDKQQQPPQQNSNPTIQETVEAPNNIVPAASLVYSVLDFPKRPPTFVEMGSRDTEYAAVSYLTEKRSM